MSGELVCPHCDHANAPSALRCQNCGADLVAAEPTGRVPLEHRSLVMWALLFIPGIALAVIALMTDTVWLGAIGLLLLAAPLLVQLFGAHWTDPTVDTGEE